MTELLRFGRFRLMTAGCAIWIGAFYEAESRILYVNLLPCLTLRIQLSRAEPT